MQPDLSIAPLLLRIARELGEANALQEERNRLAATTLMRRMRRDGETVPKWLNDIAREDAAD